MTLHKPWAIQPAVSDPDLTYTAQEIRMYATGSRLTDNQVLGAADLAVTQRGAGANFSVDVAAGIGSVAGDDIASQGEYGIWNDATVNVATPSAPGSGTRVHRLVVQVRDKQSNGTYTTYDAVFSLLQDTGGGTPAEPASAMTLALASISAGQVSVTNSNITDQRIRAGIEPLVQQDTTGSQTVNTVADQILGHGAFVTPVIAAAYKVTVSLSYLASQTGGVPSFSLHSPASSVFLIKGRVTQGTSLTSFTNNVSQSVALPTLSNGVSYNLALEADVVFTAAGLLSLQASTSIAADTFVIYNPPRWEVQRVRG